jgi:hypothetical protein
MRTARIFCPAIRAATMPAHMSPTPDRLPCLTPGCPNTIQPATAARTGGYCGPCATKRDRAAREAYIRANRKDVDRYAGVTDPVELICLIHTPPRPDPLVNLLPPPRTLEDLYLSLTPEQASRLMQVAADSLDQDIDRAEEIAKCLAAFTDFTLDTMLEAFLEHDDPYPALIFRGSGPRISDRLLHSLCDSLPSLQANHILSALAWIGDESVIRYLQLADVETTTWSRQLHLAPTGYTRVAGWELVAGERRELTLAACVAIHVANDGEARAGQVRVMQERADACPWCGCKLANLLKIDLTNPPLDALRHIGPRVEVATCPVCTCFSHVHAQLDPQGHGHWMSQNIRPKYLPPDPQTWETSPWANVAVRLAPRRPMHAADWCLPTTLSQIGGHPAWVQDVDYPACLKCGQTMTFLAQIDQAVFPLHEGVYYAFLCPTCRTTATAYQQT